MAVLPPSLDTASGSSVDSRFLRKTYIYARACAARKGSDTTEAREDRIAEPLHGRELLYRGVARGTAFAHSGKHCAARIDRLNEKLSIVRRPVPASHNHPRADWGSNDHGHLWDVLLVDQAEVDPLPECGELLRKNSAESIVLDVL